MEKLCVFCEHFRFSGGEPGYSEMTPGSDAWMCCDKNIWDKDKKRWGRYGFRMINLYSEVEFRDLIKTAESCEQYQQVG